MKGGGRGRLHVVVLAIATVCLVSTAVGPAVTTGSISVGQKERSASIEYSEVAGITGGSWTVGDPAAGSAPDVQAENATNLTVAWTTRFRANTSGEESVPELYPWGDERVYVTAPNGTIHALDHATGRVDWQWEHPGTVCCEVGTLTDEYVLILGNGSLYAVDRETGRTAWSFTAEGEAGELNIEPGDDGPILAWSDNTDTAYGLSRATGEVQWRSPLQMNYVQEREFDQTENGVLAVGFSGAITETEAIVVRRVDRATGNVTTLYETERMDPGQFSLWTVYGDEQRHRYLEFRPGRTPPFYVEPLQIEDSPSWRRRGRIAGGRGDYVYLRRNDTLSVVHAPTNRTVRSYTVEGDIDAARQVVPGGAFLHEVTTERIRARTIEGNVTWTFGAPRPTTADGFATAFSIGDTMLYGPTDGYLYGLHRENGTLRWQYRYGDRGTAARIRAGSDGTVYVATRGGRVVALDPPGAEFGDRPDGAQSVTRVFDAALNPNGTPTNETGTPTDGTATPGVTDAPATAGTSAPGNPGQWNAVGALPTDLSPTGIARGGLVGVAAGLAVVALYRQYGAN